MVLVHALFAPDGIATTPSHASVLMPVSLDDEKLASLKTVLFMFSMIGAAWAFYYSRRHAFPTDGVAYISLLALSFSATSISMNMLNKVCVTLTGAPSTLTTIQMLFTVIATVAMSWREVYGADRIKVLKWMIVPVMYAGMLNSSLLGFSYLSLSLVVVFRNLAPLLTMSVEGLVMDSANKPTVTAPVVGALLMMVAGALVFSRGESGFSWIGLGVIIMNTILAMADRLLQRRLLVSECKDLPLSACMTINNTFGMIPTFAMAYGMHEIQGYHSHAGSWTDPITLVLIALSCCMGMGIGYFGLMVQKVMTATSMHVLQNASKVGVVAAGVVVFGERLDSPARICGMALSIMGSAAYGLARANEQKQPSVSDDKGESNPLLGQKIATVVRSAQSFQVLPTAKDKLEDASEA